MLQRRMLLKNYRYKLLDKIVNRSKSYYVLDDVKVTSDNYLVYYGLKLLDTKNMSLFGTRNSGGHVEEPTAQLGLFYFNKKLRHAWGNAHIDHDQETNKYFEGMLDVNSGNTGGAFVCNRPFCIFTNWSDGVIDDRIADCEFYYLKNFSSKSVLIHDFRPCKCCSCEYPCIVDLVTNKIYKPILV